MTVFAVNRNEVFGFDELKNELLLFLAAMAGDVNGAASIVVINERAAAKHVVKHAEDSFFVSRDDAGGEDDGIVFVDRNEAMIVDRDAREGGHGLGSATAGEDHDALRVKAANILRTDDMPSGMRR